MSEYRQISPYKCGQLLMRLEKCKVQFKKAKQNNFKSDFTKESIEKYIANRILNN